MLARYSGFYRWPYGNEAKHCINEPVGLRFKTSAKIT